MRCAPALPAPTRRGQGRAAADDQDMDRNFLRGLRELKPVVLGKEVFEELLALTQAQVQSQSRPIVAKMFRGVVPALFAIGAGLSTRDLRDIFEDLVVEVIEPLVALRCTADSTLALLDAMADSFPRLRLLSAEQHELFGPTFRRFLVGVRTAVCRLYPT